MSQLERIQEAVETAGKRTPAVVLSTFLPELPTVFGLRLRKFSLGAYLALERLGHPFVLAGAGASVEASTHDIATALHVMVTPSAEVFRQIGDGTIQDAILETADTADLSALQEGVAALMRHLEAGLEPLMPMRAGSGGAQKKTAGSAGA